MCNSPFPHVPQLVLIFFFVSPLRPRLALSDYICFSSLHEVVAPVFFGLFACSRLFPSHPVCKTSLFFALAVPVVNPFSESPHNYHSLFPLSCGHLGASGFLPPDKNQPLWMTYFF